MRLNDIINKEQIDESMMGMIGSIFFINDKKNIIQNNKTIDKTKEEVASKPFGGVCKYKNSVLIPETPEYRMNDEKLIRAAAQMFRGNWVNNKDAQSCLKNVLSHLLSRFISKMENDVNDIDLGVIADSLASDKLEYDKTNSDFRTVNKVFTRIKYHKERIFDKMISEPGNFKDKWVDAKEELSKVIENILKNGGETTMALGQLAAERSDNMKEKIK